MKNIKMKKNNLLTKFLIVWFICISFVLQSCSGFNTNLPSILENLNQNVNNQLKNSFNLKAIDSIDPCLQHIAASKNVVSTVSNKNPIDPLDTTVTITGYIDISTAQPSSRYLSNAGLTQVKLRVEGLYDTALIPITTTTSCAGGKTMATFTKDIKFDGVKEGFYTITVLDATGTVLKTILPSGLDTQDHGLSTEILVSNDPIIIAKEQIFDPDQLRMIFSKVSTLYKQDLDATANALLNSQDEIDLLNKEISSVTSRISKTVDSALITEFNLKLTELTTRLNKQRNLSNSYVLSLKSSLDSMSVGKDDLRNYINDITGTSGLLDKFTEDYLPIDKPKIVEAYEDQVSSNDYSFMSEDEVNDQYISSDGTTLVSGYSSGEKIEQIKIYRALDLAGLLANDIKYAQDLANDYSSGLLSTSGLNGSDQKDYGAIILANQVKQINEHNRRLNSRLNKNIEELDKLYKGYQEDIVQLTEDVAVPLALAMQSVPELKDNKFVTQALKPLPKNFSIKTATDVWNNTLGLVQTFWSLEPSLHEIVNMKLLGYNKEQWDQLPPEIKADLVSSTEGIFDALTALSPYPLTPRQAVDRVLFGAVFKVVGKVSVKFKESIITLSKTSTKNAVILASLKATKDFTQASLQKISRGIKNKLTKVICKIGQFNVKSQPCNTPQTILNSLKEDVIKKVNAIASNVRLANAKDVTGKVFVNETRDITSIVAQKAENQGLKSNVNLYLSEKIRIALIDTTKKSILTTIDKASNPTRDAYMKLVFPRVMKFFNIRDYNTVKDLMESQPMKKLLDYLKTLPQPDGLPQTATEIDMFNTLYAEKEYIVDATGVMTSGALSPTFAGGMSFDQHASLDLAKDFYNVVTVKIASLIDHPKDLDASSQILINDFCINGQWQGIYKDLFTDLPNLPNTNPKARDVTEYLQIIGLTWHHQTKVLGNLDLVPYGIHDFLKHFGGNSVGASLKKQIIEPLVKETGLTEAEITTFVYSIFENSSYKK